jgi:hypothetical protein
LVVPGTGITATGIPLRSAHGATTPMRPMLAPLMAITALAGLSVVSLSVPALGIADTGDAAMAMATVVRALATVAVAMAMAVAE